MAMRRRFVAFAILDIVAGAKVPPLAGAILAAGN
jgi:hypothetical protein